MALANHRSPTRQIACSEGKTGSASHVYVRSSGAGASHAVLDWLAAQRLSYSVDFALPTNTAALLERIPAAVWPSSPVCLSLGDGSVAEVGNIVGL